MALARQIARVRRFKHDCTIQSRLPQRQSLFGDLGTFQGTATNECRPPNVGHGVRDLNSSKEPHDLKAPGPMRIADLYVIQRTAVPESGMCNAGHGVENLWMLFNALHDSKAASATLAILSDISTCFRAMQPLNADLPMLVTELGILVVSRAKHDSKAASAMLVTESGISTFFRALRPFYADIQMLVTELGILMVSMAKHDSKAASAMLGTESGISTYFSH